jgi:23S rRNA (uracil747-C5)-methyltransferase
MKCHYFESHRCRSCSHLVHEDPQHFKKERIAAELHALAPDAERAELYSVADPTSSRGRVKLVVGGTRSEPVFGITRSDYSVEPLESCPLHYAEINRALPAIKSFLTRANAAPYDITARQGEVKGVHCVANATKTEMIVRFILRSTDSVAALQREVMQLCAEVPSIKVVSASIQPIHAALFEGDHEVLLTERDTILERYTVGSVVLSAKSFVQVTHAVADKLYDTVRKIVASRGFTSGLDLFCGVGGFSFAMSPYVSQISGYEFSAAAVAQASRGAQINGYSNITFKQCDLTKQRAVDLKHHDVILVNPPRRGLGEQLCAELLETDAHCLIYSSCSIDSLKRDLEILKAKFSVTALYPFDMFPLTDHVEVLVVLERAKLN